MQEAALKLREQLLSYERELVQSRNEWLSKLVVVSLFFLSLFQHTGSTVHSFSLSHIYSSTLPH